MKKIISILVVLVFASSAMAAVTLDVEAVDDCTDGWVKITYDSTGGPLPRAFSLKVEVDAGVIEDVDTSGCEPFNIYMGTIEIVGDQIQWNDPGYTPVAPGDAPDDPCQLGTEKIVLEMGSLYDMSNPSDPNKPLASGDLIKIKVSDTTATMTVTSNALRGKVVLEDTSSEDSGVVVDLNAICNPTPPCPIDQSSWNPGVPDLWMGPEDVAWLIDIIDDYPGYYCDVQAQNPPCNPDLDLSSWNPGVPDLWLGPEDVAFIIDTIDDCPGYYCPCP